jgi:hypothetical protein
MFAGKAKETTLRGVRSRAEGMQLLANLRAAVSGALVNGFALGVVRARWNTATGIRSRNQQAFEESVGDLHNVSDASATSTSF